MSSSPPENLHAIHADKVLLVADTDETQTYVFESSKLPEIRGASLQLDTLNARIGKRVKDAGGELIYASGGGLLALVPPTQAEGLVREIEALYPRETGAATITAVACPLPPDYNDQAFGQYAAWAVHQLQRRKESSKPAPPFFQTLAHQSRCESCQQRPALAGNAANWCAVCLGKRRFQQRNAWFDHFLKNAGASYPLPAETVYYPHDLAELSQASQPKTNHVAFIYLDGDSIGRLLQQIKAKAQYKKVSVQLSRVTKDAVFQALAKWLKPVRVTGSDARREVNQHQLVGQDIFIHPFEIITIGGDDVMLIVPAQAALPIALEIGQTFSREMTAFGRRELNRSQPITMSGGVVIADNHTPVRVLRDLAHQLQDEAKKLPGGALDFQVLKSADMLAATVEAVREQYPYLLKGYGRSGRDLRLLSRPYTYAQAQTLWDGLTRLKADGFAASQMHLLAASLLEGKAAATLFYEYQSHRAKKEKKAYAALQKLLLALQRPEAVPPPATPAPDDPLPWRKAAREADFSHDTALWDIAELYDFVP